ncbi:MAG: phBC6A51 family helix-turn-helix protein [Bacteroidales bacterium]
MKYSKKIVKDICELIASDDYTIAEICKAVGISESIYFKWKKDNLEFLESIKKAQNKRIEFFKVEARKATAKKITGYDYEEVKTIYKDKDGKPAIKEKTVVKKHVPPDTAMLIFVLKNTDPENFKDKQEFDLAMPDGLTITVNFKDYD